jgi:hypothetical protein
MSIKRERLTEDEKVRKAEELNNYESFDVHVWSEHPEVNRAVDALYHALKKLPEFEGNERLRKRHVKVVILDLYVKWLADPTRYSSYYRRKNAYSELDARYNKLHISRLTVPVVDALRRLGYLEHHTGYQSITGKSYMSRMRATRKLIDIIVRKHKITPTMVEKAPNTECIILRDYDPEKDQKIDVPYQDTDETKRMRKDLQAYNNLLRGTLIDIRHFPKEGVLSRSKMKRVRIDFENQSRKFVRRIFNNASWGDGGRFYGGWWQRLPKEWRNRITIFGLPTHEVDYSGLHIVIMYAIEGIDYWKQIGKDPYQIGGYEKSERMRVLLKQVLLTAINAKTPTAAVKAVNWEVAKDKEEFGWVKHEKLKIGDLIDSFAQTHSAIRHRFFKAFGVKLQKIDSTMAEHVINEMTPKKIPVLCIHDSFIVIAAFEEALRACMQEAFQQVTSSLSDVIGDKKIPKISQMGLTTDQFGQLWGLTEQFELPKEREGALRKLGLYDGPKVGDQDLGYVQRMKRFRDTDWVEEYYKDDIS